MTTQHHGFWFGLCFGVRHPILNAYDLFLGEANCLESYMSTITRVCRARVKQPGYGGQRCARPVNRKGLCAQHAKEMEHKAALEALEKGGKA